MYDCYEEIIHGINVKDNSFCCYVCDRKRHGDSLLVGDRENDKGQREICIFSETSMSQHHNIVLH